MAYNEFEKDLADLDNLPLIKNPKRINVNTNTQKIDKVNNLLIRELEKRVKLLEKQFKSVNIDIDRMRMKQTRINKQQTQREIDGYNSQQENISK